MFTSSNSGHAINVANLAKFNQVIQSLGVAYNPANALISAAQLNTLQQAAENKLQAVNNNLTDWKNKTNTREQAFEGLSDFCSRLATLLGSFGVAQQTIDDMRALTARLRSGGKLTKADASTKTATTGAEEPAAPTQGLSTSHLSYDERLDTFSQIVLLLQAEPLYQPNEAAFSPQGLQGKLAQMQTINQEANAANVALKTARIERNSFLYDKTSGALAVVKMARLYVKGLKGGKSEEYQQLKSIKFVRIVRIKKAA